uniref:Uncharacterized protein n=1 Tax=Lotharella globosa TaxID=91324 RepID=A0A7S3YTX4_9EUKA|mmetsp:Transcript_7442/g.14484  ORF Transcript_7442/g.14484 Transcript_7442/m.14484 type:complete len:377 (+) Transcript_7442:247-1377(+)
MTTATRSNKPWGCSCCCVTLGGEEDPRDMELRHALGFQSYYAGIFTRDLPFSMFFSPCADPCCCFVSLIAPWCVAARQRVQIIDLEGRDYYSCLNLDERLAKVWCCSEDSRFQKCNCMTCKFRGRCMMYTCALCESCLCLTLASQANRWSVQRLGEFRTNCCEDCVVWTSDCCVTFWSNAVLCWKSLWCVYCLGWTYPFYYASGGAGCQCMKDIAYCIYAMVMACWLTQTQAAIRILEEEKNAGVYKQRISQYQWRKPLEVMVTVPIGVKGGSWFGVRVPDGRILHVRCPMFEGPGYQMIVTYQPRVNGLSDHPPMSPKGARLRTTVDGVPLVAAMAANPVAIAPTAPLEVGSPRATAIVPTASPQAKSPVQVRMA